MFVHYYKADLFEQPVNWEFEKKIMKHTMPKVLYFGFLETMTCKIWLHRFPPMLFGREVRPQYGQCIKYIHIVW
jgi:hypothetical protein